ncbi:hypothetical protein Vi05172_g10076 [Venturia inaequalis]|nr:hypothetical protein Vi05172_g10076 [Venturia inaequalis]
MADMSNEDPNVLESEERHTTTESVNPPPSSNPYGFNGKGDPCCKCGRSFAANTNRTMKEAVEAANKCRQNHLLPVPLIAT